MKGTTVPVICAMVVMLFLFSSWGEAFSPTQLAQLQLTNVCPGCDLSNANLAGSNLTDAKLSGANLNNADLSGANLTRADLTNANLTNADLSGATWTNGLLVCANGSVGQCKPPTVPYGSGFYDFNSTGGGGHINSTVW